MPSIMDRQVRSAYESIRSLAGHTLRYRRGASSVDLIGVPGRTSSQREGEDGAQIESPVRDYMIRRQDLQGLRGGTEPLRGDQVHELDEHGQIVSTATVMPTFAGERPWSLHTPDGTVIRVHTRSVDDQEL